MRPNSSMPLAAEVRACASLVTSSGSLSNRGWSAMDAGSRAVATTASLLARTASVIRAPNPRDAPVMNQVFMGLFAGSPDHLGQLDEVAERIRDECQATADDPQLEGLGHDRDAATAELGDGGIQVVHIQAEVVIAGQAQAVAQVGIDRLRNRLRIAVAEQLDVEVVVRRWANIGQLQIVVRPFVNDTEVELLDVPALRGFEIRHADGDVVTFHRRKWAGGVVSGRVAERHRKLQRRLRHSGGKSVRWSAMD